MVERFELDYDDTDCACISNFLDNGEKLTDREVVDLLNILYEENEKLRVLLKEAEDEIKTLKKSNRLLQESLLESETSE